jgi:hypothetical protein
MCTSSSMVADLRVRFRGLAIVALLFMLACSAGCEGDNATGPTFPNLTKDEWYSLCGIWVRAEAKGVNTREGSFSWGKARHAPYFSVDIDLGSAPPRMMVAAAPMEVRSVERIGSGVFRLSVIVKGLEGGDRPDSIVANLGRDHTLQFSEGSSYFGGPAVVYVKIDGPKR